MDRDDSERPRTPSRAEPVVRALAIVALALSVLGMLCVTRALVGEHGPGCSSPQGRPASDAYPVLLVCWAVWAVPLVPLLVVFVSAERSTARAVVVLACGLAASAAAIVELLVVAIVTAC